MIAKTVRRGRATPPGQHRVASMRQLHGSSRWLPSYFRPQAASSDPTHLLSRMNLTEHLPRQNAQCARKCEPSLSSCSARDASGSLYFLQDVLMQLASASLVRHSSTSSRSHLIAIWRQPCQQSSSPFLVLALTFGHTYRLVMKNRKDRESATRWPFLADAIVALGLFICVLLPGYPLFAFSADPSHSTEPTVVRI